LENYGEPVCVKQPVDDRARFGIGHAHPVGN
jgi:hypothetical protein